MENSNTFDILLYRSNTIAAKAIRMYTGSKFDHISLIFRLKTSPHEVFVLDTNSNHGVHIKRWSKVERHIGAHFKYIVLRQLKFTREKKQIQKLEEFMR